MKKINRIDELETAIYILAVTSARDNDASLLQDKEALSFIRDAMQEILISKEANPNFIILQTAGWSEENGLNLIRNLMKKDFLDIKIGDDVIVYDEYSHDYVEHCVKIESIENNSEYVTAKNPQGIVYYGVDTEEEYFGDDYISVVTESNFLRIKKEEE